MPNSTTIFYILNSITLMSNHHQRQPHFKIDPATSLKHYKIITKKQIISKPKRQITKSKKIFYQKTSLFPQTQSLHISPRSFTHGPKTNFVPPLQHPLQSCQKTFQSQSNPVLISPLITSMSQIYKKDS